jgi:uncharacterized delta-60 repeat protein
MKTTLTNTIAAIALTAFCHPLIAAPGDLDTTFGTGGKVTTPIGASFAEGHSVAIQEDGKIVVAGNSYNGSDNDFAVARYNANGSLDMSFNGTGKVTTAIGNGFDYGRSVALQSDGKIVVAGSSWNGTGYDCALVRYNANGSLDTTFNGTGKVITAVGFRSEANSVAVQGDGKIVVGGAADVLGEVNSAIFKFAVVRYNANGSLDTTFNGTGKVITATGSGESVCYGVAVQTDGKIVAAGVEQSTPLRFAVVRYNANGSLDTTFNGTGKVTCDFGTGYSVGRSVALQSDGKIVVGGQASNGSAYSFAVVRYDTNGTLDASFNGTGKLTTPIGSTSANASSLVIKNDGKIVVAGDAENATGNNEFALVRYNANGSLDTSFNGTGKATTDVGAYGFGSGVAVQNDGNIVVAGWSGYPNQVFVLVRYVGELPPTVTTDAASSITATCATLNGTVNPNGQTATAQFQYGPTTSYGSTVNVTLSPNNGTNAQAVSAALSGLTQNTLYHYRLTATNNGGSSYGTDLTFTTPLADTDHDSIPDIYETGTGIYVSPTDTGTSPTNSDSDGDGLTDGQEVNTYHTNPNIADTDGDGFSDSFEISTGFSPTSAASTPDALSSIRIAAEYRFNAALGISYRIEASTDLVNWSTIETPIIGAGSVITRFYSIEGQPKRFFRSRRN